MPHLWALGPVARLSFESQGDGAATEQLSTLAARLLHDIGKIGVEDRCSVSLGR